MLYNIKPLENKDILDWMTLERKCFSSTWNYEQYQACLIQSHFIAFGLWQCTTINNKVKILLATQRVLTPVLKAINSQSNFFSPKLLGYVTCYHIFDEMEILNIAVNPSLRKLGFGSYLLNKVIDFAKKKNVTKIFLEVRMHNEAAKKLYEKFSFIHTGIRPKYYTDSGEDAYIYVFSDE